jgi:hypothetical protein
MTEVLKCPECAAPLNPPADGARTMRCPYCQCTVLLSHTSGTTVVDMGAGPGAAIGGAMELAHVTAQLRAGNKIEAIRIYRQLHGCDLATAKAAVERLAAGQAAGARLAARAAHPRPKVGVMMAIFGAVIAVLVVIGGVVRVLDTSLPNQATDVVPAIPATPAVVIPPAAPPAPPAFANEVLEFGSEGIGAGQFKDARSIGVDAAGHIFVGEYEGGRIQVFDAGGKFLKTWRIDSKSVLSNLAVNRDGTLIAVMDGKIVCYEGMTGRAFGEAANSTTQPGFEDVQESYMDACFALDGDIYAIDSDSNIVNLDSTGQIKRIINGKQATGEDELQFDKIAVNGNGQIYVVDRKLGIMRFAADGRYINRFGMADDPKPTDDRPDTLHVGLNLAIDGQGRIFVGDMSPAIKVFDSGGRFVDAFGGNDVCFGLAVNDQNEIFGCFRNDHVVRKFDVARRTSVLPN